MVICPIFILVKIAGNFLPLKWVFKVEKITGLGTGNGCE